MVREARIQFCSPLTLTLPLLIGLPSIKCEDTVNDSYSAMHPPQVTLLLGIQLYVHHGEYLTFIECQLSAWHIL